MEVINSLFDAVFPEVVHSLEPLVRRVVSTSRALGLTYQAPDTEVDEKSDDGFFTTVEGHGGDFVSDDEW